MKKTLLSLMLAILVCIPFFAFNASAAEMADGIYEVNIALWHSEDDKESMAASSVEATATIKVENGIRTMHIRTGEMSMMGMKASLQELRISDKNGNFADATVESKNSEGNPTGFYFTLPHTDEYITVKVNPHLSIMGNRDIGARIRVDYSTLRLIKAAETTAAEPETTVVHTVDESGEEIEMVVTVSQTEAQAQDFYEVTWAKNEITETEDDGGKISPMIFVAAAAAIIITVLVIIVKKRRK